MKKLSPFFAFLLLFLSCTDFDQALPVKDSGYAAISKGDDGEINLLPRAASPFTVTTFSATYELSFGATSGGSISSSGGGASVTERGVCYSTNPNPTTADYKVTAGSGAGSFICHLSALQSAMTYYVRAYGIKKGTATYGNLVTFTTASPNYGTVTDVDGNVYTTITIGTQVWMMENLRTTSYRDATPIPNIINANEWAALTSGAYGNYNNDEILGAAYGRLYNWYAVNDPHNLAPAGWHVASLAEWNVLENYVGGSTVAGARLKEIGSAHWAAGGIADNTSGFTAFGGGFRRTSGSYGLIGDRGDYWTSTEWPPNSGSANAYYREMNSGEGIGLYTNTEDKPDKNRGYSVRCVKD